jgi:hypothetical protein
MKTLVCGSTLVTAALFLMGTPASSYPVNLGSADSADSGVIGHTVDNPSLNSTTSPSNEAAERSEGPTTPKIPGACVQGSKVLSAQDANACSRQGGIWNTLLSQPKGSSKAVTDRRHRADDAKGGLLTPERETQRTGE